MANRLEGKTVAITGAASGLGEATARLMVAEGATALLADIQDDRGRGLAQELGDRCGYLHCDVRNEEDVAAFLDAALALAGRVDCLVNNAGIIGAVGPIDSLPLEEYELTMAVELRSVFLGMKHAARVMKPQSSGVILSMSSVGALRGSVAPHCYGAAKAAIIQLTHSVAAELGAWSIRVNAIAPGGCATPGGASFYAGDPNAVERLHEHNLTRSPLRGRAGEANDVAHAALWLASDDAGFISGHTLVVDGGLTTGSPAGAERGWGPFAAHQPLFREGGQRGL